jgi:hypothetical protein
MRSSGFQIESEMNMDWLYGALAAAGLTGIGFLVKRRYFPDKPQTVVVEQLRTNDFRETKPLPKDIFESFNGLAPFAQGELAKTYFGQEVQWKGRLDMVYPIPLRSYHYDTTISMETEKSDYRRPTVTAQINISVAPRFKVMHKGVEMGMSGVIRNVDYNAHIISLTNAKFTFFD